MSILKKGLKGAPVKRLQEKLGVTADGDFGPGTEKALKEFQKANGLTVDGVAGPDTFTAIGLPELILLRRGVKGATVRKLQEALGISADGAFGPGTERAVRAYQEKQGLKVDGIAGPATLAKMDAFDNIDAATVAAAKATPAEAVFEAEPLPEINGTEVVASASPAVEAPVVQVAETSVWGRIKGWF